MSVLVFIFIYGVIGLIVFDLIHRFDDFSPNYYNRGDVMGVALICLALWWVVLGFIFVITLWKKVIKPSKFIERYYNY